MFKIYGLKEIGTSNIKYVGYTGMTLNRRLACHKADKQNSKRNDWIQLCNKQIEIVLLIDDIQTKDDALIKEKEMIDFFNNNGAELANSECIMTIEAKKRMSERLKGNSLGKCLKGIKRSDETKQKMSDNQKEKRKTIYQYTICGNYIKTFPSAHQVKEDGFSQCHVSTCAKGNGQNKTHKGFIWVYEETHILIQELKEYQKILNRY